MRKLLLVALLALLVTGGIAAVYRGPLHPAGEDANAADKASRTKSHVMFDPSEYAADGKPVPESFLKTFHFDLAYWRGRLPPGKPSEPMRAGASTETPARVSQTEPSTPAAARAIIKPAGQLPHARPEPLISRDTVDPMAEAFLMAGITPALDSQTALKTGIFAGALPPAASPLAAAQYINQNSKDSSLSDSFSELFDKPSILQITQDPPSMAGATSLYRSVSWSRYFVLSPAPTHFAPTPEDDDQPVPDPFLAYPAASKELNPSPNLTRRGDANLGLRSAPDPTPEPRTLILCGLALTLLWWRHSHSA